MSSASQTTGASDGYAGPRESKEERKRKIKALNLSAFDLFNPSKPWVLVENGSMLGYFNWVPRELRVGPWSPLAAPMLFLMVYSAMCGNIVAFHQQQSTAPTNPISGGYPDYQSGLWHYNVVGFLWITFISISTLRGPAGPGAWATYTMWSWTILWFRHGLAAMAPWLEQDSFLFNTLELTRFPMLLMHSMVFVLWNFVLMPFVYFFFMKNAEQQRMFLGYFTRFRLIQVHIFNLFFAYMNGVVASPPRLLALQDFMVAISMIITYVLWYLLVLDRIGVHIYPIFSPRTPWLVVTWLLTVGFCSVGFFVWKQILAPPSTTIMTAVMPTTMDIATATTPTTMAPAMPTAPLQ